MEGTCNRSRILDRDCPDSIADNFENGTDEEGDEVVGLILDERLVELDDCRDEVEDCCQDGECEAWVVEPDVVGVFLPILGHGECYLLEIRG